MFCVDHIEAWYLSTCQPGGLLLVCELHSICFLTYSSVYCSDLHISYYIIASTSNHSLTSTDTAQLRFINGHTLAAIFSDSLAGCTERYGHPIYHYHRVDLHKALMELAQNPSSRGFDGSGKPVVIRLAAKVVGIKPLEATLTLEDGLRIQKDLLVIADGINVSHAVTYVVQTLAYRVCFHSRSALDNEQM
jgi:hypothetical protein